MAEFLFTCTEANSCPPGRLGSARPAGAGGGRWRRRAVLGSGRSGRGADEALLEKRALGARLCS
eukprot:6799778-Pyramimonas_sp.AAC.1